MKYPKGYKGGTQTERLEIRLSPKEKDSLISKAEAAHLSVTKLLLCSALDKKIIVLKDIPAFLIELRKIGTNINQIAKVANAQNSATEKMLEIVNDDQKEIIRLLNKLLNQLFDEQEHNLKTLEQKIDKILENQNS